MLKTRLLTALILLPIVLLALFSFPKWAWALFSLLIAALGLWEWSRFFAWAESAKRFYLMVSFVILGAILSTYLGTQSTLFARVALASFVCAALFWLIVAPLWLLTTWRTRSPWVMALVGWLVVIPTWLAMLSLREVSPWVLLSFAVLVWVADIAAYFVGKSVGRHKLAFAISPGKTIEGAIGGLVGVALYFFAWRWIGESMASQGDSWARAMAANGAWLLGFFMLLAVASILGDLFESWMKRGAALKDSSNLLPGHGGVLDRIDALTSTLPLAALYVMLTTQS